MNALGRRIGHGNKTMRRSTKGKRWTKAQRQASEQFRDNLGMNLTAALMIRVTPEERETFRQRAHDDRRSLSGWARLALAKVAQEQQQHKQQLE